MPCCYNDYYYVHTISRTICASNRVQGKALYSYYMYIILAFLTWTQAHACTLYAQLGAGNTQRVPWPCLITTLNVQLDQRFVMQVLSAMTFIQKKYSQMLFASYGGILYTLYAHTVSYCNCDDYMHSTSTW